MWSENSLMCDIKSLTFKACSQCSHTWHSLLYSASSSDSHYFFYFTIEQYHNASNHHLEKEIPEQKQVECSTQKEVWRRLHGKGIKDIVVQCQLEGLYVASGRRWANRDTSPKGPNPGELFINCYLQHISKCSQTSQGGNRFRCRYAMKGNLAKKWKGSTAQHYVWNVTVQAVWILTILKRDVRKRLRVKSELTCNYRLWCPASLLQYSW